MKPLACAIDIVQKDENMYIGYLLPTISVLQRRLEHLQMSGLAFCTPLVIALLTGIHKRYDHLFEDRELLIASVTIPRFKTMWVSSEGRRQELQTLLQNELNRQCYGSTVTAVSLSAPKKSPTDDFFSFALASPGVPSPSVNCVEADRFMADSETGIESLHKHELVRKVFVRYNTALASSASVERVFSVAADVFTRKRGKMTDENFERQLLLKLNKF